MHQIGVKMQTIKKCIFQQIDDCLNMYLISFILNTMLGYSQENQEKHYYLHIS